MERPDLICGVSVYTYSTERYGKVHIVECMIEERQDNELLLYSTLDNRSFYRNISQVMTYDELMDDINTINHYRTV